MSVLHTLGLGAVGGTALTAAQTCKYARQYATLDDYAEQLSAIDREHLLNQAPMPPLEEPPRPVFRGVGAWHHAWWIAGFTLLIVPPLLGATVLAGITATSSDTPGQAIPAFLFGGLVTLILSAFVAVVVAVILASIKAIVTRNHKVEYDVADKKHQLWEIRNDARLDMVAGRKPVEYLRAIDIDPQSLSV